MQNYDMQYADFGALPATDDAAEPLLVEEAQALSGTAALLLVAWVLLFGLGLAVIRFAGMPLAGAMIMGLPTLLGMMYSPAFALCIVTLALPIGGAVAVEGVFTLDRGVGIALAASFVFYVLAARPAFQVQHKVMWLILFYSLWIFLSPLWSANPPWELVRVSIQFQLLIYAFIIYWILENNGEHCLRWVLRAYVIGAIAMTFITVATGMQMSVIDEVDRFTGTLGDVKRDPNAIATIIVLGFLSSIYLFAKDKGLFWRSIYIVAFLVLPVMVIRTGSRGGLIAMMFTLLSPLLFVRQVLKKPAVLGVLLVCVTFASLSAGFLIMRGRLAERLVSRLTERHYAEEGLSYRVGLMKASVRTAIRYPMGTTYTGWFARSGSRHFPHSDFFYTLGLYGFPAGVLFVLILLSLARSIQRMPLGPEKLFARAILTFLVVMGLNIGQNFTKHFWVFVMVIVALSRITGRNPDDYADYPVYGDEEFENAHALSSEYDPY